ncbi:MAG: hypothetical protein ABR567_01655 [Myxococcales bacterium]
MIGSLWNGKDKPMKDGYTDDNTKIMVQTASGHQVILEDKNGDETIVIADKSGKRTVTFDVKNKKFLIEAKEGDVEFHAEKKIVLQCEDIEIKTRKTGKVDIGDKFELKVAQKLGMKAGPQFNIKADKVNLNPPSLDWAALVAAALAKAAAAAAAAAGANAAQQQAAAQAAAAAAAAAAGAQPAVVPTTTPAGAGAGQAGGSGAAGPAGAAAPGGTQFTQANAGPAGANAAPAANAAAAAAAGQVKVQVVRADGTAQANLEFELVAPDGTKHAGKTDDQGSLEVDNLPQSGDCTLDLPDVKPAARADASVQGRIRFVEGGVTVKIGAASVVEIPPRTRRCRLSGLNFETNKTFLLPAAMTGIRQLVKLFNSFDGIQGLVNGHTDKQPPRSGDSFEFNRKLSVERAEAIAAYLTDDVEAWQKFYAGTGASGQWGVREDQFMLSTVKDSNGAPFYDGQIDGQNGSKTKAAYRSFQRSRLVDESDNPTPETRRELVRAYMQLDGTSLPKAASLEVHGCGLTHPLPETEGDPGLDQPKNRRVEVYLFDGAVDPKPVTPEPRQGCDQHAAWVAQMILDVDLDQPPGVLKVRVVDEQGQAPPGVHLHASGPLPLDADGAEASFADLVPGSYEVIANAPGFLAADDTRAVPAGGTAEVALTLKRETFELDVLVETDAKQPIPDAQVEISAPGIAPAKTNDKGLAHFSKLPQGNVRLTASHPSFTTRSVDTPVPPRAPVSAGERAGSAPDAVPILLSAATGNVTITVRAGSETGPAIPNAKVSLNPPSGAPLEKPTDGQGVADFPAVPAGKVLVVVDAKGFDSPNPEELVVQGGVAAGKTIALKASPATLVVKVVDGNVTPPALPPPIGGATVRVLPASGAEQTAKTKDKSDKNAGEAKFEKLGAGSVSIRVQADGFAQGQATQTLTAGATTTVEVVLKAATGTVAVAVTDDVGAAVDDKDVLITVQPPGSAKSVTGPTKSGKARFEGVPPGQSKIIAAKPGFGDGEATADVKIDQVVEVPVQLKRLFGELTVTVTTASGELLRDAVVTLERGKDKREAKTVDGGVTPPFKDVPVGKWKVSARLDNFTAPAPEEIDVKQGPGQTKTITLTPNAITAQISPAPLVVVLAKHNCKPARKPVRLSVTAGFGGTGTGEFKKPSKNTVRFFTAVSGGAEIAFNGTDNKFTAAQLTAGVQLFAEGGVVSTAQQDTDLQLELSVGNNKFGAPAVAKATCVDLTLDLFQSRPAPTTDPAPMAVNDKTDVGRFVHVQDPGFHHRRAWLVVREVQPAGFTQDLELRLVPPGGATGAVTLFPAEDHVNPEAAVGLPHPVTGADLTGAPNVAGRKGVAFFVEGKTVSGARHDVVLQLGIKGDEPDGDRAAFTVVRLSNLVATIPSTPANTPRNNNNSIPASVLRLGTGAAPTAREYDELFAGNAPIVLVENSVPAGTPIALTASVAPAGLPVRFEARRVTNAADKDSDKIVNDLLPKPAAQPTANLTSALGATPITGTLLSDSVGSFHVRAFIDCNGNNTFDDRGEPFIVMNCVLVRVQGARNNSASVNTNWGFCAPGAFGPAGPPPGNAFSASSATGLQVSTGAFNNAAVAATHNDATVNLIGGGPNGLVGLDSVFLGWVNNELDANTAGTRPNTTGEDVVSAYLDNSVAPPATRTRISVMTSPPGNFLPGVPQPGAPGGPPLLGGPCLDTSPFANQGQGGNLCIGTEGAVGPPVVHAQAAPVGTPGNVGKSIQVEMWDSPGDVCPARMTAFPAAVLANYRFNIDFRSDLVAWTNPITKRPAPSPSPIGVPPGPPGTQTVPDQSCCLYSTVQTNQWNIRFAFVFGPAPANVPAGLVTMTKDVDEKRVARAMTAREVRFPIVLRLLGIQERP